METVMNIPHRRQDIVTRWEQTEMEEYASMEEERFRELIRLRTMRNKVLTAADETELLNDAVRRLGVPLSRARSIMLAEADTKNIELESDLGDTAVAMMKSMASPKGKLDPRASQVASPQANPLRDRPAGTSGTASPTVRRRCGVVTLSLQER